MYHKAPGLVVAATPMLAARFYFIFTALPLFADNLAASSISITIILFWRAERSYCGKEISLLMTAAKYVNGSL